MGADYQYGSITPIVTLVLAAGITSNWRSAIVGALAAIVTLAVIVAILGVALVTLIPLNVLRFVIGVLLLLFGLKWLKTAIQRYSGLRLLHDEAAIYRARVAEARARGEPIKIGLAPFGVLLSYKSVLLEGLEVAFIVISFGSSGANGISQAAVGAVAAAWLVTGVGLLVRTPLQRIPENTLKFVVGRELRHHLALLRPVSAPAGGPLPAHFGPADHGHQAAKAP